jgi:hypothetical protein
MLIDVIGPQLAKAAGPAARSALKCVFRVTDGLGRSAARFREKAEDFVAEARAEYDAEKEAELNGTDDRSPISEA